VQVLESRAALREQWVALRRRAGDVFAAADPVRESRALACVYVPVDMLDALRSEVQYLQEGARVHKAEMDWLALKLERQHESDLARLKQTHADAERALNQALDDITCVALGTATHV
jgi:hypothetical protein